MKQGYSILLGEILPAKDVEYRDCERFQVVCPACREPVFKAVRESEQHTTHYLSHYGGVLGHADCELRVERTLSQEVVEQNKLAREQRLALFLRVMQDTIRSLPVYRELRLYEEKVRASAGVRELRKVVMTSMAKNDKVLTFEQSADDHLARLRLENWALTTSFAEHVQRRIARDMWVTLHTPPARANWDFLFNHAFACAKASWEKGAIQTGANEVTRTMTQVLNDLIAAKEKKAGGILYWMQENYLPTGYNQLSTTGKEDGTRSSYLMRTVGNTLGTMAGTLLELPYFELLRKNFGDSTKHYPLPPGAQPTDPAAREALAAFNKKHGLA